MDSEALTYALRLLKRRDRTRRDLEQRLESRFGPGQEDVVRWLVDKGYLDDRRYTANLVASHPQWGRLRMEAELERRGIGEDVRTEILAEHGWPSVREAVENRMARMKLKPPLGDEDAARIARTLGRLGFDPFEIESELERLL